MDGRGSIMMDSLFFCTLNKIYPHICALSESPDHISLKGKARFYKRDIHIYILVIEHL